MPQPPLPLCQMPSLLNCMTCRWLASYTLHILLHILCNNSYLSSYFCYYSNDNILEWLQIRGQKTEEQKTAKKRCKSSPGAPLASQKTNLIFWKTGSCVSYRLQKTFKKLTGKLPKNCQKTATWNPLLFLPRGQELLASWDRQLMVVRQSEIYSRQVNVWMKDSDPPNMRLDLQR